MGGFGVILAVFEMVLNLFEFFEFFFLIFDKFKSGWVGFGGGFD
jgi:hypothetical protein